MGPTPLHGGTTSHPAQHSLISLQPHGVHQAGTSAGPSLPEDDIHDEAVPQKPPDTHSQVEPHDGDLEPEGQEGPMADIEEQVRGQQAVVGAHEAILQVTAVDLPGRGGEEALHAAALPAQPLGTWEHRDT